MKGNFGRNALVNPRVFREKDEEQTHEKAKLAELKIIKEELQEKGWELAKPKQQPTKKVEYIIITDCGEQIEACYKYVAHYTRHSGSVESLWVKAIKKKPTRGLSLNKKLS